MQLLKASCRRASVTERRRTSSRPPSTRSGPYPISYVWRAHSISAAVTCWNIASGFFQAVPLRSRAQPASRTAAIATRTSRIACPPRPAWTLSATILHPEELEPELRVRVERARGALPDDRAVADHVRPVRERERQVGVLLDQQDRRRAPQLAQHGPHHLHDRRRQTLEGLVEQQEVHVAHERAGDRQELELTARQGRAAGVPEGQELGECREDALDGPARGTPARDREVLEDREVREDPPPLRHEADPAPRDLLGRPARHVGGPVGDPPVARRDDAGNRRERGRLARAVPAEERDEFSREDVER